MFCKECGSPVEVGAKYCDHCGSAMELKPLVNGENNNIDNVSLAGQLKELASSVESLENVLVEIENANAQLQTPEPRQPRIASKWWGMKLAMVPAIFLYILCIGNFFAWIVDSLSESGDSGDYGSIFIASFVVFLIPAVVLTVGGVVLGGKRTKSFNEIEQNRYSTETQKRNELLVNAKNRLKELNALKASLVNEIQSLMIFNGKELNITDEYFYSEAIRFFAERIDTGRSKSIAEAMDAFDEYAHRLKLEQSMERSAKNLAAVRRSNAINAAVNIADTIHHW